MDADSGFCKGCFRTLEEIVDWRDAGDQRRSEILGALDDRRRRLGAPSRTGNRRGRIRSRR